MKDHHRSYPACMSPHQASRSPFLSQDPLGALFPYRMMSSFELWVCWDFDSRNMSDTGVAGYMTTDVAGHSGLLIHK